MKPLFAIAVISAVLAGCGPKTDSFEAMVASMPEVTLPLQTSINEYDPGKPFCYTRMDSAFVVRYLGQNAASWRSFRYWVCGKRELEHDLVGVFYTQEQVGGAMNVFANSIAVFSRTGVLKGIFAFNTDVCCSSDPNVDGLPYRQYNHTLNADLTLQTQEYMVYDDKGETKDLIRTTKYEMDSAGIFMPVSTETDAESNFAIYNNGIGNSITLGMSLAELESAFPNGEFKREEIEEEGGYIVEYNLYEGDVIQLSLTPTTGNRSELSETIERIEVINKRYHLAHDIRVRSSFDDLRKKLAIKSIYGMEAGVIGVITKQFPNVVILLNGQGYDAYPGKEFTEAQIEADNFVVGFQIANLEH